MIQLRALSVDIIEGNLGDATCSEENLRALLELSDSEDIAALSSLICSMDAVIQTELVQQVLIIVDFESAASKVTKQAPQLKLCFNKPLIIEVPL